MWCMSVMLCMMGLMCCSLNVLRRRRLSWRTITAIRFSRRARIWWLEIIILWW